MIENKIKLIQRLSVYQLHSVWGAYWRLWVCMLRIKLTSPKWLKREVSFNYTKYAQTTTSSSIAIELHEAIRLAARLHFMSATCLPKSLVLVKMLAKQGLSAKVFIGVAKSDEGIASHAWVEMDGQLIGEPEEIPVTFQVIEGD